VIGSGTTAELVSADPARSDTTAEWVGPLRENPRYSRVGARVSHVFKIALTQHKWYTIRIQLGIPSTIWQNGGSDQIRTYNVCEHIYGGVVGPEDGMAVPDLWPRPSRELALCRCPTFGFLDPFSVHIWSWLCVGVRCSGPLTPSPFILCHCLFCLWFRPRAFCPRWIWLTEPKWNVNHVST
jgi:hypothetical protein